jgi:hypothetical protein
MVTYDEYVASAGPDDVLDALYETALAKGWTVEEDRPDRLFLFEERQSARQEPRKIAVRVEDHRPETKIDLAIWCSGFTVRRYDGKTDLLKTVPFEHRRLERGGGVSDSSSVGPGAAAGRMPSWVVQARSGEFGLLFISFAVLAVWAVAVIRDWPWWSVVISVAVVAITSTVSGLTTDFLARRAFEVTSRRGVRAQLRRAGVMALVGVVLLVWLWRM